MRLVILGNAGAGKTTLARRRASDESGTEILPLDAVAWAPYDPSQSPVRRPHAESADDVETFCRQYESWIVEGCYAELARVALRHANELVWIDPGTDICLARCRDRAHEPEKFATEHDQDAVLDTLLEWVAAYDDREDELGRAAHRAVFENFAGDKRIAE